MEKPQSPHLTPRQVLTKWIAKCQLTTQSDGAPLQCFKLYLSKEGTNKHNTVGETQVTSNSDAEGLASEILEYAQQDANGSGSRTTLKYYVKAYFGTKDGNEARLGRHSLPIRPDVEDDDDAPTINSPQDAAHHIVKAGLDMMRIAGEEKDAVISAQQHLINRLMIDNDAGNAARVAAIEAIERVSNDQTERVMKARQQLRRERQMDTLTAMVMKFVLPSLLARKGDLDTATAVLLGNMTPEQIENITQNLRPDQYAPFGLILQRAMELKTDHEAEAKKIAAEETKAKELIDGIEDKIHGRDKAAIETVPA